MKKTQTIATSAVLAMGLATGAMAQDNPNLCEPVYAGAIDGNQVTADELSACEDSFHDRVSSYVYKFSQYKETKSMLDLAECGRFGPLGDPNALVSIFRTPQEQAAKTADDGWTCLKVAGDNHVRRFNAMYIDGREYYQTLTDAYCIIAASGTKSGQAQRVEVDSCKTGLLQLGLR